VTIGFLTRSFVVGYIENRRGSDEMFQKSLLHFIKMTAKIRNLEEYNKQKFTKNYNQKRKNMQIFLSIYF